MANIEVTSMNIDTRTCQIHSERNGYTANLQVTFPRDQTIPKFSWLSETNVDSATTIKILQNINRTADHKKKLGQRCLLYCLKTLATSIDEVSILASGETRVELEFSDESSTDSATKYLFLLD